MYIHYCHSVKEFINEAIKILNINATWTMGLNEKLVDKIY